MYSSHEQPDASRLAPTRALQIFAPEDRERSRHGIDGPTQIPGAQQRDLFGQFCLQRIRLAGVSSHALNSAGSGFSNQVR